MQLFIITGHNNDDQQMTLTLVQERKTKKVNFLIKIMT